MGLSKNVVYRFADDLRSDEPEFDEFGNITFRKGDILDKGGKQWQVDKVQWELPDEASPGLPTLRVYLVNARVN
jgi:hypothetical protein